MTNTFPSKFVRPRVLSAAVMIGMLACSLAKPSHAADLPQEPALQQSMATVKMIRFRFSPPTITVRAGDTVLWQNTSSGTHTVTADSVPPGAAAFDSGDIGSGGQFSHTFTVPGEHHYYCRPHRGMGMVGTVVVEP